MHCGPVWMSAGCRALSALSFSPCLPSSLPFSAPLHRGKHVEKNRKRADLSEREHPGSISGRRGSNAGQQIGIGGGSGRIAPTSV